jgi:hypothetical protein
VEKFSASVAKRHMGCTASANLDVAIPNWVQPEKDEEKDNAANRGTMMHALFAGVMGLKAKDAWNLAKAIEYVAVLRQQRRFNVVIEQPMQAAWLDTAPTTTADLVLYVADEIHIFDLKTGVIPVEAVDNDQMMYYAATYGQLAPKAKGVHLHIVQPWADNMEVWYVTTSEIAAFMAAARKAEADIQAQVVDFNPGDHCMFCPANPHGRGLKGRPFCPAMMELLYPQEPTDEDEILKGI